MSMIRPTLSLRSLAAFAVMGGGLIIASAVGFVVGRKWPIETVQSWFVRDSVSEPTGWKVVASAELPRYEMLRVIRGDTVYVFGGFHTNRTEATDRVQALALNSGTWLERRRMPVALTHTAAVLLNDTVWIAGGFEGDHPGPATPRVWRYALRSDTWSAGPALPAPRGGGAVVARHDTLHFFGGWLPDRRTDSQDHWTLSPGDSVWRSRAPLPFARGHLSASVIDGFVYAIGGTVGHDPVPIDVRHVHRYTAATNSWERVPDMPKAISHVEPATLQYGEGVITVGGRSRTNGDENVQDVYLYRPGTGQWRHLGLAPVRMLGGLAVLWNESIVAGLGAPRANYPETRQLWRAPLRNHWWNSRAMPIELGEVSAGVMEGGLFVVGEGSARTLRFDLARGDWHVEADAARPAPGNHHAAEVVGHEWYLLGGLGGSSEGTVQIFEARTRTWRLGPRMPFAAGASASAVIDSVIYVAGGIEKDRTIRRVAALDLRTMHWRDCAPMPLARNHAASGTDGRRLYVFGGRGPGSGDGNDVANGFADVQVYDPRTDSWTVSDGGADSIRRLPQARGGMGRAAWLGGEFWIIGGETLDGAGATNTRTYDRVDRYDPLRNRWSEGPTLPTARHGIFPVVHEGRLFVAGGGLHAGYGASGVFEIIWPR
jgi:N-acetylneuraminic acid mutarotase